MASRSAFSRPGCRCLSARRAAPSQRCVVNQARAGKGPVVIVDNYDSFTFNLSQYLGTLSCDHIVVKNDELTVQELADMNPAGVLISPGPGAPEDSGISLQICLELGPTIPIFGVCMGHQCIGQAFGGKVIRAPSGLMHGKTSPVTHLNKGVLKGLASPFKAARYHSLVIEKESCPECLEVIAWTEDGTIMAVQHEVPALQACVPPSIITGPVWTSAEIGSRC
jgi:anthranilate synthase component 2